MDVQLNQNTATSDKISAYYSLVFPTITYYLQTPNVTIGRRCIPPNSPSSSTATPQIDIDLGSLKSVSRLHANIEYDEAEERWVLAVHGRNGAWVDGVWIQPGKRTPLNERCVSQPLALLALCSLECSAHRSQIQIASRTFHFELPPPPDTPPAEDMPSPATSHVSLPRGRSPSVDITSISPDSSIPSCSPPPPPPPPVPGEKPRPASSKSEGAGKNAKSQPNPKKRKKSDIEVPIIKPEVMPPKPPYTYAQLCYRAIKARGGKATLQDIIGWMIDSFEWYKYNVGSGWEVSSRIFLSRLLWFSIRDTEFRTP
jgi:forkhead box protein K